MRKSIMIFLLGLLSFASSTKIGEKTKMRAFAMLGLNKVGWIEKDIPDCGPFDALLRPLSLAVCTSDVHTVYEGAIGDRHNLILGHEGVGQVIKVGSLVKKFKVGDKVIIPAITPDWGSDEAQEGYPMHSGGMLAGWKYSNVKDGVFSEVIHVNEADANLAILPKEISIEEGAMISDMVTTGFHGAELADVQLGDTVCVIGIGPVGLMSVKGANLKGASRIFAVGSRKSCVDVALQYGATDIINYKNGDIVEQVLKATNGKGVDKVIIAGGNVHSVSQAIRMLKPGGKIGNVMYFGGEDIIDIPRVEWGVGMADKNIVGGLTPGGRVRMEKMASLIIYKKLDVKPLITHYFDGMDKLEEALELMRKKPEGFIKSVVRVHYDDEDTLH